MDLGPEVFMVAKPQPGKRRYFSLEEKQRLLAEANSAGESISSVARRYGLSPSLLFRWRRLMDEGAVTGLDWGEQVVGVSEVKQLKAHVRELERLLGKKTLEAEILKEALSIAREKKLLLRSGWRKDGDSQ
jgi:transposase